MPSNKYGMGRQGGPQEVSLPSGNVCLARRLQPADLIKAGILDRLDALTGIVSGLHLERMKTGRVPAEIQEQDRKGMLSFLTDPAKMGPLMETVDQVTLLSVVEPELRPAPGEGERREEDVLYVDQVDMLDKFKVMTFALERFHAETEAMEPFRSGSSEAVVNLGDGEVVPQPAERAAGSE